MRSLSIWVLFTLVLPAFSSPVRRNSPVLPNIGTANSDNAYSGAAGVAQGGSVKGSSDHGMLGLLTGDADIVNIDSSRHTPRHYGFRLMTLFRERRHGWQR